MLVKYWKNFKWFLFIPLIVFIFIFKISNVSAYVYKGYYYDTDIDDTLKTGTLTDNTYVIINLDNALSKQNNDIFAFQFPYFMVVQKDSFDTRYEAYCTNWYINAGTGQGQSVVCTNWSSSQNIEFIPTSGMFNFKITAFDNSGRGEPCFLSSEYENTAICPMVTNNNIKSVQIQITVLTGSSSTEYFSYKIQMDKLVVLLNNDNTDITLQQQQTNTNLQYIYQYQQNDSVSGSTTQVQGDFTDLAQSFNSELQGVNDLSQLVLMPISLFMDLSTDNCQPLHLQIPYVNMSVDLPCMKAIFNQYFNGLYSIFTTIMSAVICYWVAIKTGALVKEIVDCDNDRIEVVDL